MNIQVQTFTEEIQVVEYIKHHEELEFVDQVQPIRTPDDFVIGKRVFYELNKRVGYEDVIDDDGNTIRRSIYKYLNKFKEIQDVQGLIDDLHNMQMNEGIERVEVFMKFHNFVQEI